MIRTREAAEYLGVSPALCKWRAFGGRPRYRKLGRVVVYDPPICVNGLIPDHASRPAVTVKRPSRICDAVCDEDAERSRRRAGYSLGLTSERRSDPNRSRIAPRRRRLRDKHHTLIYSAMVALTRRGLRIDPVTVADELAQESKLHPAGGKDYIGNLLDMVPAAADVSSYALILHERAQRRRIATQLLDAAPSTASPSVSLDRLVTQVAEIGDAISAATQELASTTAGTAAARSRCFIWNHRRLGASRQPHTEASQAALLVTAICSIGTLIGRGPFWMIDGARHGVNNFALLVGPTSNGRKGTAVSRVRALLKELDEGFVKNALKAGLSTGQGVIYHVRDERAERAGEKETDAGVSDKRLLIVEAEMATGLRQMRRDRNTLSPIIREAWDGYSLSTLTKGDPLKATDPHIGIVGQITPEELRKHLDDIEFFSGFLNRFLLVWTERSQFLPFRQFTGHSHQGRDHGAPCPLYLESARHRGGERLHARGRRLVARQLRDADHRSCRTRRRGNTTRRGARPTPRVALRSAGGSWVSRRSAP